MIKELVVKVTNWQISRIPEPRLAGGAVAITVIELFVWFATKILLTTATYMENHLNFAISNIAPRCDKMCIE